MKKKSKKIKSKVKENSAVDKVNIINKELYRVIKNRKMFGAFQRVYVPLDESSRSTIARSIKHECEISFNGLRFRQPSNTKFKERLLTTALILKKTFNPTIFTPDKLRPRTIVEFFVEDYFKQNPPQSKINMNLLKFETMFGLIFLFVGLLMLATMFYLIFGHTFLMFAFGYISLISFYAQYKFYSKLPKKN